VAATRWQNYSVETPGAQAVTFDDETLMAYADGELDEAARAAVEVAMAADPDIARRVARHRELRGRLRAAFEPVLTEPLPERLLASVRGARRTGSVVPLGSRSAPRWSWPQWAAIAASLVIGVLSGALWLRPGAGGGPITARNGQMLASGELSSALSNQLASTQSPNAPVHIGVSFRTRDGVYCRTFVLADARPLAGLACRERGSWQLQVLARSEAGGNAGGAYRPAASSLPPAVARTLETLIAGEPLDAAAESAARAHGWSR
jgi:hypothetical protein